MYTYIYIILFKFLPSVCSQIFFSDICKIHFKWFFNDHIECTYMCLCLNTNKKVCFPR